MSGQGAQSAQTSVVADPNDNTVPETNNALYDS